MGILQIQPVTVRGVRLLVSLFGMSESGKTLSALKLAAGIEPDPAKRALLDTEGGQRGRFYEAEIPGGYQYASLSPPFTPARYAQAVTEMEEAGINVLVVDSFSHIWFAEGGVLDMVENSQVRNDMAKWKDPKRQLAKATQKILHSDMHIILCSRAKQPLVEEPQPNGKAKLVPGPIVPIQEKTLKYDLTVMALMTGGGKFTIDREMGGKCPGKLRPIFEAGETMNEIMGRKLAEFVKAESAKSPQHRALENRALKVAEQGVEAFRKFWGELTRDDRALIANQMGNYQSIAEAADEEEERQRKQALQESRDASDPFGTSQQKTTTNSQAAALPQGADVASAGGLPAHPHPPAEAPHKLDMPLEKLSELVAFCEALGKKIDGAKTVDEVNAWQEMNMQAMLLCDRQDGAPKAYAELMAAVDRAIVRLSGAAP